MAVPEKYNQENPQFAFQNKLMAGLVGALTLAAEHEQRANRMEDAALLDPVTELPNRRAVELIYDKLTKPHQYRRESDLVEHAVSPNNSILLIDMDKFKQINDECGHEAGDDVLRQFGDILLSGTRKEDLAARWAGDEFILILPETTEANAVNAAQNILARANEVDLHISVGVAHLDPLETLSDNVERADTAMYAAKNGGRDQVVSYSDLLDKDLVGKP